VQIQHAERYLILSFETFVFHPALTSSYQKRNRFGVGIKTQIVRAHSWLDSRGCTMQKYTNSHIVTTTKSENPNRGVSGAIAQIRHAEIYFVLRFEMFLSTPLLPLLYQECNRLGGMRRAREKREKVLSNTIKTQSRAEYGKREERENTFAESQITTYHRTASKKMSC